MIEKSKCEKFLKNIFFQSYINETFFNLIKKLGVDFSVWPSGGFFETAKKFWLIANTKSYSSALIEVDVSVPDEAFNEHISEQEIKIYYNDYLSFLLAIDLQKKIQQNPESAKKLCEEFLYKKTSTAKYLNLESELKSFVINQEEKIKSGEKSMTTISGFSELSRIIGGFNQGRITICTAHSGFGKTNLGINILISAMQDNMCVVYVNMEMDSTDMVKRILQGACGINSFDFENGNYLTQIDKNKSSLVNAKKCFFTDGSAMSLSQINQTISEINKKNKVDFLIVDYDQKIVMDDYDIDQEWMYIKKAVEVLEETAKRESIHILLFAQTNEDAGGMPIASKRAIQPASAVLHFTKDGDSTVIKFVKNRFGPTDKKIEVAYLPEKSSIKEIGIFNEKQPLPPPPQRFKPRFS